MSFDKGIRDTSKPWVSVLHPLTVEFIKITAPGSDMVKRKAMGCFLAEIISPRVSQSQELVPGEAEAMETPIPAVPR